MTAVALLAVALLWGATAAAQQHDHDGHEGHSGRSLLYVTPDGRIVFDPPPAVADPTESELRAAARLLRRSHAAARRFRRLRAARALGYTPLRRLDRSILMPHLTHRGYMRDRATLQPRRPESLVYRRDRHGRLRLVGFMFRMAPGPTTHPAGRYLRWHVHGGCVRPREARGTRGTVRQDRRCAPGHVLLVGETMMVHVWLTDDVATAFSLDRPLWPWARVHLPDVTQ